jgi:hypothetical protein
MVLLQISFLISSHYDIYQPNKFGFFIVVHILLNIKSNTKVLVKWPVGGAGFGIFVGVFYICLYIRILL